MPLKFNQTSKLSGAKHDYGRGFNALIILALVFFGSDEENKGSRRTLQSLEMKLILRKL
jgi:hypothetical protein